MVQAFKIPSGSMIPTLQVGDHIFVNKFIYGVRVPWTNIKFGMDYRKPRRGEVIVFIYPKEPEKDFIKRVVGLEGDTIEVHRNVVFVNGEPLPRHPLTGPCTYWDVDERRHAWREELCAEYEEELDHHKYLTINSVNESWIDFPRPGDPSPYVVPAEIGRASCRERV